jgi:5-hydroxyisourate hydrolase-like protein (transthyretin family)
MPNYRLLFSVLGFLAISKLAVASGGETVRKESDLYGYVVDVATRKPVAGVVVSASSSKNGISKEVATDADGFFKFSQLPTGEFSLQFDKKGYRNVRKEAVAVKEGIVTKLTIEFYSEKTGAESVAELDHPVLRLVDGIW